MKQISTANILRLVTIIVSVSILVLGGGFVWNEVIKRKVLTYTVLPTYDLGDESFSGLVVENPGRVTLTEIEVIVSDLDSTIEKLNIPGLHETMNIERGGLGENELTITMPRLSGGSSLAIYIVTAESVTLEEGVTFKVTSLETTGEASSMSGDNKLRDLLAILMAMIVMGTIAVLAMFINFRRYARN